MLETLPLTVSIRFIVNITTVYHNRCAVICQHPEALSPAADFYNYELKPPPEQLVDVPVSPHTPIITLTMSGKTAASGNH